MWDEYFISNMTKQTEVLISNTEFAIQLNTMFNLLVLYN